MMNTCTEVAAHLAPLADAVSEVINQRDASQHEFEPVLAWKNDHNFHDEPAAFPQMLMVILSDSDNKDAISWLPDGSGFVILNRKKLLSRILPLYSKLSKYTSFTRRLKRWGFVCSSRGPGICFHSHKLFFRDYPELSLRMRCQQTAAKHSQQGYKFGNEGFRNDLPYSQLSAISMGSKGNTIQHEPPESFTANKCKELNQQLVSDRMYALPRNVSMTPCPLIPPYVSQSIIDAAMNVLHRSNSLTAQIPGQAGVNIKQEFSCQRDMPMRTQVNASWQQKTTLVSQPDLLEYVNARISYITSNRLKRICDGHALSA